MTATNILCSRRLNAAIVATDAAVYQSRGIVTDFTSKMFAVAHWPGVVAVRGSSIASPFLGSDLSSKFESFDAMVAGIEDVLPAFVGAWNRTLAGAALEGELTGEMVLAGWSTERGAAEVYTIRIDDTLPISVSEAEADASTLHGEPFKLVRLPDSVEAPVINDLDLIIAADWNGVDETDLDSAAWSMLHMLEMQRQADFGDGIHWIGGFAQISIVTADGVTQRMLKRWTEDEVGYLIRPTPIDWPQWHLENPKPKPNMPIELSRVRRDMLKRKQRKESR
ncbi:MAG: hypothetical protein K9G60_01865 [Pseudolabrys sp.]|nr:hypothetical protein [Pseudolabrys sp.]